MNLSGRTLPNAADSRSWLSVLSPLLLLITLCRGGVVAASEPTFAAERLSVGFGAVEAPATMRSGTTYLVKLQLRNTGTATWKTGAGFHVSYHWLAASDRSIVVYDGVRTDLPRDVAPGETIAVCASVLAPSRGGRMLLQWDLVQEGVTWFSQALSTNAYLQPVAVRPPPMMADAFLTVLLWLVALLAHFLLIAFWVIRFSGRRDLDEIIFHGVVVGLGTLLCVLNALAFSIGLSLWRGLVALALLHVGIAVVAFMRGRRTMAINVPAAGDSEVVVPRVVPLLSIVGLITAASFVVQWAIAAAASLRVTGTDAAHYHVPHAVNIALGANLFGLPATPHLYPMGTSVLAAWFIVPVRDPLLVDLTTLLPFLLAWAAILKLFREASGESGVTFGPWCALPLFTLPLLRHSLAMSADLFYMAAFLALNAGLLKACIRLRVDALDRLSLALSAGMLVSTKVTGNFSAVTLLCVYGSLFVAARFLRRRNLPVSGLGPRQIAPALLIFIASGGIWVIRNWWSYGSPLAPSGLSLFGVRLFEGATYQSTMYYLSVLKDLRDVPNYDVTARLAYWSREWLGTWFLPCGILVVVLLFDVMNARRKSGRLSEAGRAKLILLGASTALAAAHLVLLAGVPWSSLEWSRGFSLRFVLPFVALYGLIAYAALFPESMRWWDRYQRRAAAAVMVAAIAVFIPFQGSPGVPLDESVGRLTPAAMMLAVVLLAAALAIRRMPRASTRGVALVVAVVALAGFYAAYASRNDSELMRAARTAFERATRCGSEQPPDVGPHRSTYFSLVAYERSAGVTCNSRRIFTTTRWDVPLDLQSPDYENSVFDMRGPTFRPSLLRGDFPGARACDYVIASQTEMDTSRGVALVNALKTKGAVRAVARYGPYIVLVAETRKEGARRASD